MSRTTHTDRNLAARMGRWSAAHWKTATFGWLAFVLVAFGLGGMVGTRNIDSSSGPGESGRMNRILEAGFEQPVGDVERGGPAGTRPQYGRQQLAARQGPRPDPGQTLARSLRQQHGFAHGSPLPTPAHAGQSARL